VVVIEACTAQLGDDAANDDHSTDADASMFLVPIPGRTLDGPRRIRDPEVEEGGDAALAADSDGRGVRVDARYTPAKVAATGLDVCDAVKARHSCCCVVCFGGVDSVGVV